MERRGLISEDRPTAAGPTAAGRNCAKRRDPSGTAAAAVAGVRALLNRESQLLITRERFYIQHSCAPAWAEDSTTRGAFSPGRSRPITKPSRVTPWKTVRDGAPCARDTAARQFASFLDRRHRGRASTKDARANTSRSRIGESFLRGSVSATSMINPISPTCRCKTSPSSPSRDEWGDLLNQIQQVDRSISWS